MNKIKNLLKGSSLVMVILGLATVGVVSAAIVNYLSDAPIATTTVAEPVEMSINLGGSQTNLGNKSVVISTTGLSTVTFTTVAKNNANNAVTGYNVMVIEAPANEILTGKEFTKVEYKDAITPSIVDITSTLRVVRGNGTLTPLSEIATGNPAWTNKRMILISDASVLFSGGTLTTTLEAGKFKWNDYGVTLGNIVGTYKVSAQYVYDLVDYAAKEYARP
jgi:hypothetical protein